MTKQKAKPTCLQTPTRPPNRSQCHQADPGGPTQRSEVGGPREPTTTYASCRKLCLQPVPRPQRSPPSPIPPSPRCSSQSGSLLASSGNYAHSRGAPIPRGPGVHPLGPRGRRHCRQRGQPQPPPEHLSPWPGPDSRCSLPPAKRLLKDGHVPDGGSARGTE